MEFISYLFSMFAVMFWLFRLVITFAPNINWNLPFISENPMIEIILLFVSVLGLIGIFKRKLFLTSIYLAGFFAYYGYEIYNIFITASGNIEGLALQNLGIYILGLIIAFANFFDVLFNKERKGSTKNLNIDWYYDEGKYERDIDSRKDKNRYRIK